MGKIEKWHLLPSHCRYVDKTFIEMFLKKSSISFIVFGPTVPFTGCHGNQNAIMMEKKNTYKIISSEATGPIRPEFICSMLRLGG